MARKDFGAKPLSFPQPVFIIATYDENGNANAMNAAWGGISGQSEISMCLGLRHKTVKNFMKTGAFTVSMGDEKHVKACDYVGLVSANMEHNKLKRAGFTTTKSSRVNAPIINELAICMECTVKSYDEANGHLVGEIINVSVDEAVITNDAVDVTKAKPITFDPFNHTYHVLGKAVGTAFSDGAALK